HPSIVFEEHADGFGPATADHLLAKTSRQCGAFHVGGEQSNNRQEQCHNCRSFWGAAALCRFCGDRRRVTRSQIGSPARRGNGRGLPHFSKSWRNILTLFPFLHGVLWVSSNDATRKQTRIRCSNALLPASPSFFQFLATAGNLQALRF